MYHSHIFDLLLSRGVREPLSPKTEDGMGVTIIKKNRVFTLKIMRISPSSGLRLPERKTRRRFSLPRNRFDIPKLVHGEEGLSEYLK